MRGYCLTGVSCSAGMVDLGGSDPSAKTHPPATSSVQIVTQRCSCRFEMRLRMLTVCARSAIARLRRGPSARNMLTLRLGWMGCPKGSPTCRRAGSSGKIANFHDEGWRSPESIVVSARTENASRCLILPISCATTPHCRAEAHVVARSTARSLQRLERRAQMPERRPVQSTALRVVTDPTRRRRSVR